MFGAVIMPNVFLLTYPPRITGKYGVIMNETHFKELLFKSIPSPPTLAGATTTAAAFAVSAAPTRTAASTAADLMQMGFPTKL
ncbi:hypothetical protein CROQUDRAFT_286673 [Cronartium quercuum f. sp. fusiforme G11]|uniref:Uncharacterized protein n=1 Tax=Cronartium quercuum f. sp. fusiforme G11 TaxID=708437 RepID=A0A9P6T7C1_9BASI|nr:hypothetical protein CROQUDRAFT_286673 [Cronartium quercuum f. sp. fusiforme G11]